MTDFREEVSALIYGGKVVNPYEGFQAEDYPLEANGGGATPIFGYIFEKIKPQFVIEVGSWKGMSALWMANWMRNQNIPGQILCIDTWLGCPELYQAETSGIWGINGKRKFGRPQIYEQFLANVIKSELTGYILPFSTTSAAGAKWLKMRPLSKQADVIYIDGSHEEPDVLRDLIDYWDLLKSGGAMIGDDYDQGFTGVVKAVTRFAEMKRVSVEIVATERKWVIWK
jgi:hypothetical protein